MDIERLKDEFKSHVEKYDMNEMEIKEKFYHSYRVMDFCLLLAKYNNLDNNDTNIAMLIGLLHDYARFEQWTKYKTYSDIKSTDHGNLAIKRLFDDNEIVNYCTNKEYYDEIKDAIKYHNKYDYPDDLSSHNKLMCQIIRDADKLDIFYLLGINPDLMEEDNLEIDEIVKLDFFDNKLIKRVKNMNKSEDIIVILAMVFDLNFKYSFEYVKQYRLLDRMYENIKNKEKFKPYFDYVKKYVQERCR